MLVLSRKVGERIQIGDDIQLVVVKSSSGRVQIGIDAPESVPIYRPEMKRRKGSDSLARFTTTRDPEYRFASA